MIKRVLKIIGLFVILLIVSIMAFVNLSPQFGARPSKEKLEEFNKLDNYKEGKFLNLIPTSMEMSFKKILLMLKQFINGVPNSEPSFELPVLHPDPAYIEVRKKNAQLIWFGHSAFLLQMDGKNILLDPMLGETPSPVSFLGTKRFANGLPIQIESLPKIDAVVISHDHYDHLDYGSIIKLREKTDYFFCPLGVAAHLRLWGIKDELIFELNWWESQELEGIEFVFAPARHFSGRSIGDQSSTLWGSWIINGNKEKIYFSGDGGYGPHFKEIGEKYGPFDFAMMECGQYDEKWADIHMMPEETAQAAVDVRAKLMMPIHWGAFKLALHSWTDPIVRVKRKAEELNMPLIAPKIGQVVLVGDSIVTLEKWWMKP